MPLGMEWKGGPMTFQRKKLEELVGPRGAVLACILFPHTANCRAYSLVCSVFDQMTPFSQYGLPWPLLKIAIILLCFFFFDHLLKSCIYLEYLFTMHIISFFLLEYKFHESGFLILFTSVSQMHRKCLGHHRHTVFVGWQVVLSCQKVEYKN